jgi:CBS domain-containing protein
MGRQGKEQAMKVKEVMTSDPACCTPDAKLQEVARMMAECDCGIIPVLSDHQSAAVMGVVTDRDIVMRTLSRNKDPFGLTAREVMTNPVMTVTPETSIEDCCRMMEERQVRRAPVVDARGDCIGMISLADIANHSPEKLTGEVVKQVSQPAPQTRGQRMES